jgi:hypothetical protein
LGAVAPPESPALGTPAPSPRDGNNERWSVKRMDRRRMAGGGGWSDGWVVVRRIAFLELCGQMILRVVFLLSQKLTYFNGPYVVCGQRTMPAGKVLCPWVRFCACVRTRMRKLLPISSPVGSGIHGYPRPQVELLSLHMKHSKGFMCNFTFL